MFGACNPLIFILYFLFRFLSLSQTGDPSSWQWSG